uniref:Uncharacterized protein n=1 Tax=Oryza meridionalis TaxID=40149 RepID=A0A0E0DFG0_9ORYZ
MSDGNGLIQRGEEEGTTPKPLTPSTAAAALLHDHPTMQRRWRWQPSRREATMAASGASLGGGVGK